MRKHALFAFAAAANSASRRRDADVTNCFAVARPMPVLPPVISATVPSSLFMYSSHLIKAWQIVRTTPPKGGPQPGNMGGDRRVGRIELPTPPCATDSNPEWKHAA